MKALYLDNYRGFKDQIINLKSVNFFVGENSSGKTSILVALKLLTSVELYFKPKFSVSELPFVSFPEFVSKGASNRRNFTLGLKTGGRLSDFKILRFSQRDGMPAIQRMMYGFGDKIVFIDVGKDVAFATYDSSGLKNFSDVVKFCNEKLERDGSEQDGSELTKVTFPPGVRSHLGVGMIQQFVNVEISESVEKLDESEKFSPLNISPCKWIAPIRAKPLRVYTEVSHAYSAEGGHVPYVLRDVLASKVKRDQKLAKLISDYGSYSGLFESVSIKEFGRDVRGPFEVTVKHNSVSTSINNVGYGVSQVLPILLEAGQPKSNQFIAIQQPEVHLHPRAQAALGQFLFDAAVEGNKFLIETHSDYVVDRFRLAKNKSKSEIDAQVVFVSRSSDECKAVSLEIGRDGSYPDDQPKEFREFFLQEELALIRI